MRTTKQIRKAMERNAKRGKSLLLIPVKASCGDFSYKRIKSKADMNEALDYLLRMGIFRIYAGKTVINNLYLKNSLFQRSECVCRSISLFDRLMLRADAEFRMREIDFENTQIFTETVNIYFQYEGNDKEKYAFTYKQKKTYAFPLSRRNIYGAYILAEELRQKVTDKAIIDAGLDTFFDDVMRGDKIKEVFFRGLLLDDIKNGIRWLKNIPKVKNHWKDLQKWKNSFILSCLK